VALVERTRAPEKARPHYVRFVEAFLRELHPESFSAPSGEDITEYFQRLSSKNKLSDWQFRQVVDALQLLLVDLAQAPVGKQADWDYWKEAGKTLGIHDPTLANEQAPGERMATRSAGPIFRCSTEAFAIWASLAAPLV